MGIERFGHSAVCSADAETQKRTLARRSGLRRPTPPTHEPSTPRHPSAHLWSGGWVETAAAASGEERVSGAGTGPVRRGGETPRQASKRTRVLAFQVPFRALVHFSDQPSRCEKADAGARTPPIPDVLAQEQETNARRACVLAVTVIAPYGCPQVQPPCSPFSGHAAVVSVGASRCWMHKCSLSESASRVVGGAVNGTPSCQLRVDIEAIVLSRRGSSV